MPTLSNEDYITLAAQELIHAIKVAGKEQTLVLQEGYKDALVKLANIFSTKIVSQFQPPRVNNIPGNVNAPSPRVTKSNKPTASPNLNNIKAVHQQKTRSNTPISTPTESSSPRRSVPLQSPNIISQQALHAIATPTSYNVVFTPCNLFIYLNVLPSCNAVIHPVTGKSITKYNDLLEDPVLKII